jgi:hypothetical protein
LTSLWLETRARCRSGGPWQPWQPGGCAAPPRLPRGSHRQVDAGPIRPRTGLTSRHVTSFAHFRTTTGRRPQLTRTTHGSLQVHGRSSRRGATRACDGRTAAVTRSGAARYRHERDRGAPRGAVHGLATVLMNETERSRQARKEADGLDSQEGLASGRDVGAKATIAKRCQHFVCGVCAFRGLAAQSHVIRVARYVGRQVLR